MCRLVEKKRLDFALRVFFEALSLLENQSLSEFAVPLETTGLADACPESCASGCLDRWLQLLQIGKAAEKKLGFCEASSRKAAYWVEAALPQQKLLALKRVFSALSLDTLFEAPDSDEVECEGRLSSLFRYLAGDTPLREKCSETKAETVSEVSPCLCLRGAAVKVALEFERRRVKSWGGLRRPSLRWCTKTDLQIEKTRRSRSSRSDRRRVDGETSGMKEAALSALQKGGPDSMAFASLSDDDSANRHSTLPCLSPLCPECSEQTSLLMLLTRAGASLGVQRELLQSEVMKNLETPLIRVRRCLASLSFAG